MTILSRSLVKPVTVICLGAFTLSGCASMNEAECLIADWETVGYQDGAQGRPTEDISRHRKACAKHGVAPVLATYLGGWNDGVLRYCTVQNGFKSGSAGRSYAGVCPADVEEDFLAAFSDGNTLHHLRSIVTRIAGTISRNERQLETIESAIVDKEADLIFSEDTPEQRARLIGDLRALSEEKGELVESTAALEHDLGRAEVELEHFHSDMAYDYGL